MITQVLVSTIREKIKEYTDGLHMFKYNAKNRMYCEKLSITADNHKNCFTKI